MGAPKRTDPAPKRLAHVNAQLRIPEPHVSHVIVDGYEEGSSIILIRPKARNVVIPGAAAMLSGKRLQAAVGAATHCAPPNLRGEDLLELADLIWSLSETRRIHDSVDAAHDWGMSYVVALQDEAVVDTERTDDRWRRFHSLRGDEVLSRANDANPPTRAITRPDGSRLVIRPWFHKHVRTITQENGLSEQKIASLMAQAGWESLPTVRSAITAHNPDANAETVQFRFYVVPRGWELDPDDEAEGEG